MVRPGRELVFAGSVDGLLTGAIKDQYRIKVDFAIIPKPERNAVLGVDDGERFCLGVQVKVDVLEDGLEQFHFVLLIFSKMWLTRLPAACIIYPRIKEMCILLSVANNYFQEQKGNTFRF